MSVLIATEPDDGHAVSVQLALEKKAIACELLFTADMPTQQKNNIHISERTFSWDTRDAHSNKITIYQGQFDVVWWRRPRMPHVVDTVHEEDIHFVKKENAIYHDSIPYLFNEDVWWVNPIASQQKTRSKIIQLKLAKECGFKLPQTLISNSPEDIKEFIQINKQTGVIYKPFFPAYWFEKNALRMIYTDKVLEDDLPSDGVLGQVPGIYQQYIEKKYELRVTCFGSHISAVQIDSQKEEQGKMDWRKIPAASLALSELELPANIKAKILLFMKKIGVVFGCFDFIVTPDDELVFLELNEQGQFLWAEHRLPDLFYLDKFCEFIMQKQFNWSWKKSGKTVALTDVEVAVQKRLEAQVKNHVYLNEIGSVVL